MGAWGVGGWGGDWAALAHATATAPAAPTSRTCLADPGSLPSPRCPPRTSPLTTPLPCPPPCPPASPAAVAAVRVFGAKFCEVPFVATRDGYRREGNCRRLMRVGVGRGGALRRCVRGAGEAAPHR